jgi:hypothetical protein
MSFRNERQIVEHWTPILETVGITDPNRQKWVSVYCHQHSLNQTAGSGALNESAYQTLSMIPGMGEIKAPIGNGSPLDPSRTSGSGDKFPALLPLALQVAARTIGFDIVPVIPMQGPVGILTYMDYVYAGGKVDSADKPMLIKINAGLIASTAYVKGTAYWGVSSVSSGTAFTAGAKAVALTFVGKSRIDGYPIFKVGLTYSMTGTTNGKTADSTITLADVFDGAAYITKDASSAPDLDVADSVAVTATAELVKALEDHIQGVAGAGLDDDDEWFGDGADGTKDIESMSRETGEGAYPRMLGLQVHTEIVKARTVQLGVTVTTEMISDLNKQHGIDVVSMAENALANEISQHINKHILAKAFALGWSNNIEYYNTTGVTLNMRADGTGSAATSPAFRTKTGTASTLTVPGFETFGSVANFENLHTIQRRIVSKIVTAGNVIAQRGRRGAANFIVTNVQMASALQDVSQFQFAAFPHTINQNNGSLYPVGTIAGMTIYVDPNMDIADNRILIGRKGNDDEPGLKFMPYLMAESAQVISEGTFSPKIRVKSRYALVEAGHHPETQYYTLYVYTGSSLLV